MRLLCTTCNIPSSALLMSRDYWTARKHYNACQKLCEILEEKGLQPGSFNPPHSSSAVMRPDGSHQRPIISSAAAQTKVDSLKSHQVRVANHIHNKMSIGIVSRSAPRCPLKQLLRLMMITRIPHHVRIDDDHQGPIMLRHIFNLQCLLSLRNATKRRVGMEPECLSPSIEFGIL